MQTLVVKQHKKNHQRGASLLEVMIGLFVLAIGMLGFMGLLNSSLTMNQRSFTLTQAMFLAEEIVDRARANRDEILEYGITFSENTVSTSTINPKCNAVTCTEVEMAAWDLAEWMEQLQNILPGSDAEITITTVVDKIKMKVHINYNLKQGSDNTGTAATLGLLEQYQMVTEI